MNILTTLLLCLVAVSCCHGFYRGRRGRYMRRLARRLARRYDNELSHYDGYNGNDIYHGRNSFHGDVLGGGLTNGYGVKHVVSEVTHLPRGDTVHTITRHVPHVYTGNTHGRANGVVTRVTHVTRGVGHGLGHDLGINHRLGLGHGIGYKK